ncbi:MAG: hypothetical protein IJM36_02080 [Acholeplasmatales bacterium]|nr:hypothetical protein [Acholeplasmatales bacterium]
MEFVKKNISKWVSALVLLIVGILCIVAGAVKGEDKLKAYEGISITIGVALLIVASLVVILALVAAIISKGDKSFGAIAAIATITLAAGIFFIAEKYLGAELISILLGFVPYVLIVAGSILAVDGILTIVFGIIKKEVKAAVIAGVVSIVIGAVAIILGALMLGNDPVISMDARFVIFGILLIIFAVFAALATFVTFPVAVVAVKEKKENSVDAEVKDAE